MENQAAIDYIRQCFSQGLDEVAIRQQLAASGWPPAAIDQAFWQYNGIAPAASAAPATPAAAPRQATGKSWLKRLFIGLLVIFVLAIGGLTAWALLSSKSAPKTNAKNSTSSQTKTKKSTSSTTKQTQKPTPGADIQTIASQVKVYMSRNSGALPTTVGEDSGRTFQLCSTACGPSAISVTLQFFNGGEVQMLPYTKGMQVPNEQTVYLVPGASCLADGTGIGTQSTGTQPAMAFLYATTGSGSNFNQHCVSL